MKFYNRETEMAELRKLSRQAYTNGGLMSVIVGRRRVGKKNAAITPNLSRYVQELIVGFETELNPVDFQDQNND